MIKSFRQLSDNRNLTNSIEDVKDTWGYVEDVLKDFMDDGGQMDEPMIAVSTNFISQSSEPWPRGEIKKSSRIDFRKSQEISPGECRKWGESISSTFAFHIHLRGCGTIGDYLDSVDPTIERCLFDNRVAIHRSEFYVDKAFPTKNEFLDELYSRRVFFYGYPFFDVKDRNVNLTRNRSCFMVFKYVKS